MKEAPEIIDNVEQQRFEMNTTAGVAFVSYKRGGKTKLHLLHAEVPLALRGVGHGARLVKAVLDKVSSEGVIVVPHCWFVREFIERNPEYEPLTRERGPVP